jgi:hypothetical protein
MKLIFIDNLLINLDMIRQISFSTRHNTVQVVRRCESDYNDYVLHNVSCCKNTWENFRQWAISGYAPVFDFGNDMRDEGSKIMDSAGC